MLWKHHWERGIHGHNSNSAKGKSVTYKAQPSVPCRQDHALHFEQECLLFQTNSFTIIHEEFHGSLQAGLMKVNDYSPSRIRQADFIHLGLYISINLKRLNKCILILLVLQPQWERTWWAVSVPKAHVRTVTNSSRNISMDGSGGNFLLLWGYVYKNHRPVVKGRGFHSPLPSTL